MAPHPTLLKFLLKERHLQGYRTFCKEYDRVAKKVDIDLKGNYPSKAQFYRWLSGDLISLPYPDHCRILEAMFPGRSAAQLLEPYDGNSEAATELFRAEEEELLPKRETKEFNPGQLSTGLVSQLGEEFSLAVPRAEYGDSKIELVSLPNPQPGRLLDLNWATFGFGIERLGDQIKHLGSRLDVDICFGINEAGLVMATFLSSSRFSRCPIGYLRCNKIKGGIELDEASVFPVVEDHATIVLCDFEVKHSDAIGYLAKQVRSRYPKADLYFAVFGAMTTGDEARAASFDNLAGAQNLRAAQFEAIFIAATMSPPGIEPPLELR
ncbi:MULTISPECIES: hypothetical protein [unclassified Crossiella]|uniref:hypothetical protein n=1 Tax=unclassified Crossiella TaxID=2620835 RepID=UPI001FFF1215|nr:MULTISPECIES: hypothetical protein [unclassified Crossiella]MCK2244096.1 hypothetical protein [Crossiella sp. S99.2]MCK2258616.1 hypothetical protein [Crossiella sp. S99.1]